MDINNNDDRKATPEPVDAPSGINSFSEPPRYEALNKELTYNEALYHESLYTAPSHNHHTYSEQPGSKPGEAGWNMYSPGIFVNQPYPRTRENENYRNTAHRSRKNGVAGFLRAVALVIICTLFSGASAYVVLDYRINRGDFDQPNQVVLGGTIIDRRQDENPAAVISDRSEGMSAQDIYDMARSQVVGILTEAPGFFGFPGASGSTTPVSGSGFIISSDGYILTNYHVIELAHRNNLPINVVLNDGTSYAAKVVGYESSNDVAVLKIEAAGLSPAMIGNSDKIRVGQTVYAIGNPFGDLVYTMTDGIISALDRVVSVEGKSISTFQFSAAVNSGNSGGPIYNTDGEVLGIVTAKIVRGNVEGIGFAIPINDAIDIASELIEHGYISGRPLIGITGQTVSPGHAEYYDWVQGVYIRSVNPGSAAEAAGIVVGDIITELAGEEIISIEALKFALRSHRAGETSTITIWRSGEVHVLTITFAEDLLAGQPQLTPPPRVDSPDPFANLP